MGLTASALTTLASDDGRYPKQVLITVEDGPVRVGWGTTPPDRDTPLGHLLSDGDTLLLDQETLIRRAQFVRADESETATLQVTTLF